MRCLECGKIFLRKDDEPQFYFTCGTCLINFSIYSEGGREQSKDEAYRKMNTRPTTPAEKPTCCGARGAEACMKEDRTGEECRLLTKATKQL